MDFLKTLPVAITTCDREGTIIYMNEKSQQTFGGDKFIGTSLFDCHPPQANEKIRHMLATGEQNAYTISKKGQKKIILQVPYFDEQGVAGLVEISAVIPEDMPHKVR